MAHVFRGTHFVERGNPRHVVSGAVTTVARIVYFIAGIITGLLALRFVLALLGANTSNPFANFVYTASHPLVSPFFGLFNYRSQYGVSKFELETLIAIVVYSVVAWLFVRLMSVITNTDTDETDA